MSIIISLIVLIISFIISIIPIILFANITKILTAIDFQDYNLKILVEKTRNLSKMYTICFCILVSLYFIFVCYMLFIFGIMALAMV